jgi:hypothetical protein
MLFDLAIKLKLEESAAQWHTPSLSQVLVLLLAFSYAYLIHLIKVKLEESAAQWHTPSLSQVWPRTECTSRLPDILSGKAGHYCNARAATERASPCPRRTSLPVI